MISSLASEIIGIWIITSKFYCPNKAMTLLTIAPSFGTRKPKILKPYLDFDIQFFQDWVERAFISIYIGHHG
jgi:hypothetical protein